MGKEKIKTLLILASLTLIFLPNFYETKNATLVNGAPPFFTINLLVPENNMRCNTFATILSILLSRIGIGIDEFNTASWSEIYQHCWDYPGPYPIPPYSEGGYDVLIYCTRNDLDFSPFGLYDSQSITPYGDNFVQYENHLIDLAILNYWESYNKLDRLKWSKDIQTLLYDDLPEISVAYLQSLFLHDPNLTGWNPLLWEKAYQCMANWSIPQELTFNYAQANTPDIFHIYLSNKKSEAQWLNQIYTGLIERKANLNGFYGSNIATDWSTTDGLTYIVNLHPNATWADGINLNATDVKYSFELRGNLSTTYVNADLCYKYLNVTIIDENSLEFEFQFKDVFQENFLALPIIPKHIWQNIAPENQKNQAEIWSITDPSKLIGAGPYYLFKYDNNSKIVHLKQNEYFENWTGIDPYFDDIYFKFYDNRISALIDLSSGKLDFIDPLFMFNFDDIPTNTSYSIAHNGEQLQIAINNKHPWIGTGELCPISHVESGKYLRKAISSIIPREIIIEEIYNGLGSPGITPWPNIALDFDESLEPYAYNLSKARYYMEMAGFVGCKTFTDLPTNTFGLYLSTLFALSIIPIIYISYYARRKNNN